MTNHCRAFIGYNKMFDYDAAWANAFFRCDAKIDLRLAQGGSVAEAISDAKTQFDIEIKNAVNQSIAKELGNRRDSLVGLPTEELDNIRLYDPAGPVVLPITVS